MDLKSLTERADNSIKSKKVTHTINKEILENFNNYCKLNKINKSKLIQAFMQDCVKSQDK